MKRLLLLLLLIPFFAPAQVQTDAAIITQINSTIRGKTFNAKSHADAFKTIVDSKLNLAGGTMPDNFIFLDPTGTYSFNVGGGASNNPSGVQLIGANQAYIGRVSTGLRFDASGMTLTIGSDASGDLYQRNASGYFSRLAAVSAGSFLRSGGVGTVSAWSTVKLPTTMSALGLWVANSANTTVNLTATAGQSIRVNAGGTAWEAFTPGGGGIGGSTGATDNSILRADGTGGSTLQNSAVIIDDSGNIQVGTSSVSGDKTITASSSSTNSSITVIPKGANGLIGLQGQVVSYSNGLNNSGFFAYAIGSGSFSTPDSYVSIFDTGITAGKNTTSTTGFYYRGSVGVASRTQGLDLFFIGGNGYNSGNTNGGHAYLSGGTKNGSGLDGNVALAKNSAVSNWQGAERVVYIGNKITSPSTGLVDGVVLQAEDLTGSSELYTVSESGAKYNITGLITNVLLSGTTLTLTEAHRGAFIYCTSSSAVTITVPANLPIGFNCTIMQDHATGTVSLTTSGGATINGKTSTTGLYDKIGINYYKATDVYIGI